MERPLTNALALVGLLAACSVSVPPVDLYSGVSAPALATLAVIPFDDLRPKEQHEGQEPPVIPLLIWNSRIGTWMTSDETFLDEVSQDVTLGIAAALSQGRYGQTRVVSGSLEEVCSEPDVQYVASGEVNDLYGTLYQRSYLYLTPIIFGWSNQRSVPTGVARVTLEVYDCQLGQSVYRRELRSEKQLSEGTVSDAARIALADLLQQVANEVRRTRRDFYDD